MVTVLRSLASLSKERKEKPTSILSSSNMKCNMPSLEIHSLSCGILNRSERIPFFLMNAG